MTEPTLERLQKYISQAGIASRRAAEDLIVEGKVRVNGKIVRELGTKVDPLKDRVEVNNKRIQHLEKIYLAFNKPKRYLTTRDDPAKRRTIYELLPENLKTKVWPVGRLDFNTEGLLILTNDGDLTQTLSHPSKEHEKEYEVVLDKEITEGKLEKIRNGIRLGDRVTSKAIARVDGVRVFLIIHEGWNRQIRRMFSAIDLTVRNLKRIRVGKLKLKDIPLGEYREITKADLL